MEAGSREIVAPSPALQRIVVFDEAGIPMAVAVPMVTRQQVSDLILAAAAAPYEPLPDDPDDVKYQGLTCAEVMVRKQVLAAARSGAREDVEAVNDRILGRPKTTSETKSLALTYEDFLRELARREPSPPPAEDLW